MDRKTERIRLGRVLTISTVTALIATATVWSTSRSSGGQLAVAPAEQYEEDGTPTTVRERQSRISARLAASDLPAWAGRYVMGDGLSENVALMLAPGAGVAATWRGCLGMYGANEGNLGVSADGSLVFHWELANAEHGLGHFANRVTPVAWAARRYLLADSDLVEFVNAIHAGHEPRTEPLGRFLLAEGDEALPVDGLPVLPRALQKLLNGPAIEVRIATAERIDDRGGPSGCEQRYRLHLDGGTQQGLIPGLKFWVTKPAGTRADLRVTSVDRDSAEGELVEWSCSGPVIAPAKGWRLSTTRPPDSDECRTQDSADAISGKISPLPSPSSRHCG